MRLFEIENPYRKTNLPLSNYRGAYDPQTDNLSSYGKEFDRATTLWDIIDEMLEDGIEPQQTDVKIETLLATQDWLSDEEGDGAMWEELEDRPVVLDMGGKRYIIDGHNRIAHAKASGRTSVAVYYFKKN